MGCNGIPPAYSSEVDHLPIYCLHYTFIATITRSAHNWPIGAEHKPNKPYNHG